MKQLIFQIILPLIFVFNINAQTKSIGLLVKTVYVNAKIPIIFKSGCPEMLKATYQVSNGRIEENGDTVFLIAAKKGDVDVKVMNGDKLVANSKFKAKEMPPLKITIGELQRFMPTAEAIFKMQTGLKCELPDYLHEDDYKVVGATVYFSGTGFPDVLTANLYSNSFVPILSTIEKCTSGSVITFDNIRVQGPDGMRYADGVSIMLY